VCEPEWACNIGSIVRRQLGVLALVGMSQRTLGLAVSASVIIQCQAALL
jgi:hypothetical protein